MMDFLKNHKMEIGGGLFVLAALWAYFTFFSGTTAPLSSSPVDASSVSGDLLVTLGSLHTIKLDNGIFTNPEFVSLADFGVSIPPQNSGRRNPFAPVGVGGSAGTTTSQ